MSDSRIYFINIVNWDESLSVGNDKIDAQHKWLICLINKLHDHMGKDSEGLMNKSIIDLYNYVITHFEDEDRMMEKSKYSNMAEHKKEHESFIMTLNKLFSRFNRKEEHITESIVAFLVDWFIDHISNTDKKFGEYLKNLQT